MSNQNNKLFLAALKQLPPLMQTVLNNPALIDNMIAIGEQYRLTPKQEDTVMAIERAVIIQELPVSKIAAELAKLGLSPADHQGITRDFLGRIVLPMEWHVGNVQSLIQQFGGRAEEYLHDARQQFPEVYNPTMAAPAAPETNTPAVEHPLLRHFDEKVETPRGRADLLLRLTGLAGQVDEMMKAEKLTQAAGEEILRNLDTLSYAINTKDLNPLEIQSLKRRLRKVLVLVMPIST